MTDYWNWPKTGFGSSSQNTNYDLFTGTGSMDTEFLVRESVQNALDAGIKDDEDEISVKVSYDNFTRHSNEPTNEFLSELWELREIASIENRELTVLRDERPSWLVISDENTTGLEGVLTDRESPIWKFFLDWGKPKVGGGNTGMYGVGRSAILKASRIQTLFAVTLQEESNEQVICGFSALNSVSHNGRQRDNYAFFAGEEAGDIAELHSDEVCQKFMEAFKIEPFIGPGTKLIIPFPHSYITEARIKAALIAHFAPALLEENLKASVNGRDINESSIFEFIPDIKNNLKNTTRTYTYFKKNPEAFLEFQRDFLNLKYHDTYEHRYEFNLDQAMNLRDAESLGLGEISEKKDHIIKSLESGKLTIIKVGFPVIEKNGDRTDSYILAALRREDNDCGVELCYRNGMAIYRNKKKLNPRYHASLFAEEKKLSTYLNICEGGAHTAWNFTKEVRKRISDKYQHDDIKGIQDLCVNFFDSIDAWINESEQEMNTDLLSDIFYVLEPSGDDHGENEEDDPKTDGPGKRRKHKEIPPPYPKPWSVKENLSIKGFSIKGTPDDSENAYPLRIRIRVPYVDGASNPENRHSPAEDFNFEDAHVEHNGCEISTSSSEIILEAENENFEIDVGGLDENRLPEVFILRV